MMILDKAEVTFLAVRQACGFTVTDLSIRYLGEDYGFRWAGAMDRIEAQVEADMLKRRIDKERFPA